MRMVSVNHLQAGMKVGKAIYADNGRVLIGKDVQLTDSMINILKNRFISIVYIQDALTDDICIDEFISTKVRFSTNQIIEKTFQSLQSGKANFYKHFDKTIIDLQVVFKNLLNEIKSSENIMGLLTNVCMHDNFTFAHSTNVTIYTLAIAKKLGFNDKQLNEIGIGAMMHDIGKVNVPVEILNKKGTLTKEESNILKQHTTDGFEILRKPHEISLLSAHCAYQHHEHIDGTGYPRGLKGNEIHPYAKIIAIANAFDTLTSNQFNQDAMLPHAALDVLFAGAGTQFEPDYIRAFQHTVATYPEGLTVELNTGEKGVVVKYQFNAPGRPIIRIISNKFGEKLEQPYNLDLSKELSTMIIKCAAIIS